MTVISTALRNFKEPTRDQLTQNFFALPSSPGMFSSDEPAGEKQSGTDDVERMDINAVLSLGVPGEEDSYVRHVVRLLDRPTR